MYTIIAELIDKPSAGLKIILNVNYTDYSLLVSIKLYGLYNFRESRIFVEIYQIQILGRGNICTFLMSANILRSMHHK